MKILVRGKDNIVSDALRAFTEQRVLSALELMPNRIASVDVRVADLNGPRGGVDMRAGVLAVLSHGGAVFVEARAADAYAAVERAVSRLVSRSQRRLRPAVT